jgi:hypothetical protein
VIIRDRELAAKFLPGVTGSGVLATIVDASSVSSDGFSLTSLEGVVFAFVGKSSCCP